VVEKTLAAIVGADDPSFFVRFVAAAHPSTSLEPSGAVPGLWGCDV
jgi:hypothetical protein